MIDWLQIVKESPMDWLLEETNPSARYFTLFNILNKKEDDPQVVAAKNAIPESDLIKKILQKQNPIGYWEEPANPYLPKYKSSYWQIMTLSQLGMDKTDERVRNACEHIFQFQLPDGGFSSHTETTASREYDQLLKKERELPSRDEWVDSIVF